MKIKAIETEYNGYRFRSRLEARWAVFFDAGCIKYEYESEGYKLEDGTLYLPDFYLPELDVHVEVKRDTPDGIEEIKAKCEKAIVWGGPIKQLLVLSDVPEGKSIDGGIWHFPVLYWSVTQVRWGWWFFHDCGDEALYGNTSAADYPSAEWYLSVKKKSIKAVSDYELKAVKQPKWREDIGWPYSSQDEIELQETLNSNTFNAFKVARQARFEHGETPTTNN